MSVTDRNGNGDWIPLSCRDNPSAEHWWRDAGDWMERAMKAEAERDTALRLVARLRSRLARVCRCSNWRERVSGLPGVWSRRVPGGRRTGGESAP